GGGDVVGELHPEGLEARERPRVLTHSLAVIDGSDELGRGGLVHDAHQAPPHPTGRAVNRNFDRHQFTPERPGRARAAAPYSATRACPSRRPRSRSAPPSPLVALLARAAPRTSASSPLMRSTLGPLALP